MTAQIETERRVEVWDVPTRVFHWTLVVLILVAWFTGEERGAAAQIHRLAGEIIAGMLVFRLVWGFVGGEHARFADFAAGPNAIIAHFRDLLSPAPHRHLGHNPLGGVAVFLLLLTTAVIVATGLFSEGHGADGPFAAYGPEEISEVHEIAFRVLQALVVVHILGVIVETVTAKDALVPAMVRGWKRRRADEPGTNARRASPAMFALALVLGLATSVILIAANPPISASYDEEREQDRH
jgi:cytochrome b